MDEFLVIENFGMILGQQVHTDDNVETTEFNRHEINFERSSSRTGVPVGITSICHDDKENKEESDGGEELYKDVNVNLRKEDVEMTDADQGGADQHNVSQESRFNQEKEDAHVTLTTVHDTQKTKEIKQVDQYAQGLSFIPTIVDRYMDNKLEKAINKAIQAHNFDCREEAQAEKREYIELVDSTSTYEAVASLVEYELTKILLDKMEESKSHLRADYKRELYDVLVKSYNSDKDLFETYGEEAESQNDPRSKEGKSSSSSKDTSRSHHKSSGKSAHAEEPSHTIDDSKVQKNQEFDMGNNDEQPNDEVNFRPPQTWISVTSRVEKPPTSFDELMDTPIDFSAFVMNRLNIINLTQELLVEPTFNLLKGTCKSLTKLEYHFKECSKATTERLD
nr:hypothetical protein [Tanacetum cinerariifolium]